MTSSPHQPESKPQKPKETVIHIDGKPFKVTEQTLTVAAILRLRFPEAANFSMKLLTLRHGNDIQELSDLTASIPITSALHFVVLDQSPTTVS